MKKRAARPLLRAAAMTTLASCAGTAGASDPTTMPDSVPTPPKETTATSAKVHLRGNVSTEPKPGDRVFLEIAPKDGEPVRIDLPVEGTWPRAFDLDEADLPGLDLTADRLNISAHHVRSGVGVDGAKLKSFYRGSAWTPRRASHLDLRIHQNYFPPIPDELIPTEADVLAMTPNRPKEAGSKVDLQGVIVYDERLAKPEIIVMVAGPDESGSAYFSLEPTGSPLQFRIQDSDVIARKRSSAKDHTVTVEVRYGGAKSDRVVYRAQHAPKSQGLVLVMEPGRQVQHETPRRQAAKPYVPDLDAVALNIRGIALPPPGTVESASIIIQNMGVQTKRPLKTVFPQQIELVGPEWAETALPSGSKQVPITIEYLMANKTRYEAKHHVALDSQDAVWKPKMDLHYVHPDNKGLIPMQQPVYGNTKGSHYDVGAPPLQKPPKP